MNNFLFDEQIDVNENNILRKTPNLLHILLKDRTTKKNIIWATNSYKSLGKGFEIGSSIRVDLITGERVSLIRPRVEKEKYEQKKRTKGKAEVYTPTWIVKKQNDIAHEEFKNLALDDYVSKIWLEIACGEAPYMVNRYDTVTGKPIPIEARVGFLDRKLEHITKEIDNEQEWFKYACQAYQTCYGYEFQGDSLLLARENLLYTFIDYFESKFGKYPNIEQQTKIAKIISHNVFQMDGLKYTVPYTEKDIELEKPIQLNLFGEPEESEEINLNLVSAGIPVKIKDWNTKQIIDFESIIRRNLIMKFDVVIGNPPYQEEAKGSSSKDMPIYHKFMDEAYKVGQKALLITPARFLSNAGGTPKLWNEKMLNDKHLKVAFFEQDSSQVFQNTDIKGGVVITYRDVTQNFGPIGVFTPFAELSSILSKVERAFPFKSLAHIVSNRGLYRYSDLIYNDHPEEMKRVSDRRLASNAFEKINSLFFEERPIDSNEYVQIYGRYNGKRVYRWFRKDYLNAPFNFEKYKIILPKANGSGAIGEVLSTPLIGAPLIGYTETFIGIGSFDTEYEADSAYKYVKTKFARALLGILKITQDNTKTTWQKVPLQDFTLQSDIDWTKSISEIDYQLYKKYRLDEEEISFIETKVKEMD